MGDHSEPAAPPSEVSATEPHSYETPDQWYRPSDSPAPRNPSRTYANGNVGFVDDEEPPATERGAEENATNQDDEVEIEDSAWNAFRESTEDEEALGFQGCYEGATKLLKVVFIVVCLCIIALCTVVSKMSIVLITSSLHTANSVNEFVTQHHEVCAPPTMPGTETCGIPVCNPPTPIVGVRWMWSLLMCICVPYLVGFIRSLRQILFKKKDPPKLVPTLFLLVIESLHTVGLMLLMFWVLPQLDVTRAVLLMTGVGLVPSLLRLFIKQHTALTVVDVFALIIQISAVIFYPIFTAVKPVVLTPNNACDVSGPTGLGETEHQFWPAPLALVLISLAHWENFVDKNNRLGSFGQGLWNLKKAIHNSRAKTLAIVYIWKIGLTFALIFPAFVLKYPNQSVNTIFDSSNFYLPKPDCGDNGFQYDWLIVFGVQASVSFLAYLVAGLTVMGYVQQETYSLAMTLATPLTLGIFQWACTSCSEVIWSWSMLPFWNCFNGWDNWATVAAERWTYIGFFWWISQLWIARHLWMPKIERMARTDHILVTPGYCGALLEQSLSYNRRRNDKECELLETVIRRPQEGATPAAAAQKHDFIPNIKLCATMWHETIDEMTQILKSIYRLDQDHWARRMAKEFFNVHDPDYYNFECHVFFDDAFQAHADSEHEYTVNSFVKQLVVTMKKAAFSVYKKDMFIEDPQRYPTPYGGRLEWVFPGGNKMIVHMKDKMKIRHRKRWSQVMYMYYFLGYQLKATEESEERLKIKARNTFLLALDGDVDFKPDAVILLLDLMKRNHRVGAACGRIHPIGSGPMVWYQRFEYSIGHWLQKATEHVLGCVLCSPGCFSLFRGSSLMDDNVMKTYSKMPETARHHVQYDQGEDRWLCTLLLQQGYRVEYSAAADALTYAPEGFNEFFNQRRRWTPSTMSNIMDLLESGGKTVKKNENISRLYIVYQATLFITSVLGPGTIFLLIMGAFALVFPLGKLWVNFAIVFAPFLAFFIVALTCKTNTQLKVAQVIAGLTMITQMAVFVSLVYVWTTQGLCNPATWMSIWVIGVFTLAAILHPREGLNVLYFPVYFVCVPTMYLILIIYSVCNMNNISWGTREVPKTQAEKDKEAQILQENAQQSGVTSTVEAITKQGCCSCFNPPPPNQQAQQDIMISLSTLQEDMARLQRLQISAAAAAVESSSGRGNSVLRRAYNSVALRLRGTRHEAPSPFQEADEITPTEPAAPQPNPANNRASMEFPDPDYGNLDEVETPPRDEMVNPKWAEDEDLGSGPQGALSRSEVSFWNSMIKKYLAPLDMNPEYRKKLAQELKELRDKSVVAFFMLNGLFIALVWSLQSANINVTYNCTRPATGFELEEKVQPVAIVFTVIFGMVMALQVCGMLLHRLFTLLQVVSSTLLFKRRQDSIDLEDGDGNLKAGDALDLVKKMNDEFDIDSELESVYQGATPEGATPAETSGRAPAIRRSARRTEALDRKFAKKFLALHELAKQDTMPMSTIEEEDDGPSSIIPFNRFAKRMMTRKYQPAERAMAQISRGRSTVVQSDDHARQIREKYNISEQQAQRLGQSPTMRNFTRKYTRAPQRVNYRRSNGSTVEGERSRVSFQTPEEPIRY